MWLCPPLGWAHDELPLWHQELTGLGAALVGAVLLKPCDLGLSHPMGISGLYQRSQKQSRRHGGKGDKLWDAVFAWLVFPCSVKENFEKY